MIITLSGKAGSGKTTVADIISKRLKLKGYYMGGIRRKIAKQKGMTIAEFNKLGEKDPSTDLPVEEYIKKLGREEDNFIIQSRTAFHFIPKSLKVFIDVDADEAAKRIFQDMQSKKGSEARNEGAAKSIADVKKSIIKREKSDRMRYRKYYGLDIDDRKNYDLVIDSTKIPASEVAEKIIEFVKRKGKR